MPFAFLFLSGRKGQARPPELPSTSHCEFVLLGQGDGLESKPSREVWPEAAAVCSLGRPMFTAGTQPMGNTLLPLAYGAHPTFHVLLWLGTDEGFSPGPEQ